MQKGFIHQTRTKIKFEQMIVSDFQSEQKQNPRTHRKCMPQLLLLLFQLQQRRRHDCDYERHQICATERLQGLKRLLGFIVLCNEKS